MRKESKTVDIFIADDGSEFVTEQDALNHEQLLREEEKRKESIFYFHVPNNFDKSEGRGYYRFTQFAVEATSIEHARVIVTQACIMLYGSDLIGSFYNNRIFEWVIYDITEQKYFDSFKLYYKFPNYEHLFISNNGNLKGYPNCIDPYTMTKESLKDIINDTQTAKKEQ